MKSFKTGQIIRVFYSTLDMNPKLLVIQHPYVNLRLPQNNLFLF